MNLTSILTKANIHAKMTSHCVTEQAVSDRTKTIKIWANKSEYAKLLNFISIQNETFNFLDILNANFEQPIADEPTITS